MKTNLAIERCEPRLALDASQVPEGQPVDEGFLEVIQPTAGSVLSFDYGVGLSGDRGYANAGFINYDLSLTLESHNAASYVLDSDSFLINASSSGTLYLSSTTYI